MVPSSTRLLIPLAAVAGLIRWNAASSFVDGTWVSSASVPSMIEFSISSAIWTKIGRSSSISARRFITHVTNHATDEPRMSSGTGDRLLKVGSASREDAASAQLTAVTQHRVGGAHAGQFGRVERRHDHRLALVGGPDQR